MDIYINNNNNFDNVKLNKMVFIYNAINDGWIVEKQSNNNEEEKYIFKKNHENKREIFSNNYLEKFISNNFNSNNFNNNK